MTDPLFGLEYNVGSVKFEPLPLAITGKCKDLRHRYRRSWVYGHVKWKSTDYYIISGLISDFDENSGRKTGAISQDVTGLIVAVNGTNCGIKAEDSFFWITDSLEWKLPDDVLREFAKDVLYRYGRAFGDKKVFLRRLRSQHAATESVAPMLQSELKKYESTQ